MDKIVIIGARGGSQRVKNKNIRLLDNIPLINYTIRTAQFLGCPIYISSDSEEILKTANEFGVVHTIKRPEKFATNISTDYDWIYHLLTEIYKTTNEYPKQLIFLRPTTPIRNPEIVRNAIDIFDSSRYSSLRSVEVTPESAFKMFTMSNGELERINDLYTDLPNQEVPQTYKANGYIDILQTRQIIEMPDIYGKKIQPFCTEPVIEIDTEEDFKYAEYVLKGKI